jgi:membrane fusion protein, multidrug efflux system
MRRSYIWAGFFSLAIGAWLASPYVMPKAAETAETAEGHGTTTEEPAKLFQVRVKLFKSEMRMASVSARGQTEPSSHVEVRARTNGLIVEQPFKQGDVVKAGQKICGLDAMGRASQLTQAEAALASAQQDFDSTEKLVRSGVAPQNRLISAQATLDAAAAALVQVKWDMEQMTITAPVNGILVEKPAEAGSLVSPGGLCAVISVLDPIVVTTQVSEQYVNYVTEGMVAKASLATGENVEGKVRFIALSSDIATRTFKVELEVANPGNRLRAGVTTEIAVPLPPVSAHFLPSSVLGLNDKGQFGVRLMNADDTSTFTPVQLIAQEKEGAWVSGLPAEAKVVIAGQDYVRDGEKVEPVMEVAGNAS